MALYAEYSRLAKKPICTESQDDFFQAGKAISITFEKKYSHKLFLLTYEYVVRPCFMRRGIFLTQSQVL